jgi:hypothetical protein
MPKTHEGQDIEVGTMLYLPFQVTEISITGTLTGTTGYTESTVSGINGPDTHVGQPPTWPNLP